MLHHYVHYAVRMCCTMMFAMLHSYAAPLRTLCCTTVLLYNEIRITVVLSEMQGRTLQVRADCDLRSGTRRVACGSTEGREGRGHPARST
jgi:hypothetical protein